VAAILNSNPSTSLTSGPVSLTLNDVAYQLKIKKLLLVKQNVMPKVYNFFKDHTPIKTGNARNQTKLDSNFKVQATYQYAAVLDAGRGQRDGQMRGSTQAPDGMSKPSKAEATRLVKQYINTFGKR